MKMTLSMKFDSLFSQDEILYIKKLLPSSEFVSDETFDRYRTKLDRVPNSFYHQKLCNVALEANKQFGFDIGDPDDLKFETSIYARYEQGHGCKLHTDFCTTNFFETPVRKIAIIIALNDCSEYTGGDLQLSYSRDISEINVGENPIVETIRLKAGDAVAFPSIITHGVTPVKSHYREVLAAMVLGPAYR